MEKIKELTQPILSWLFGIAFIVGFFLGKIPSEAFVGVAVTVVLYWFKTKDEEKLHKRIRELEWKRQ